MLFSFSINPKTDARHKYAIALYTKDDCFAMACDSEEHQQDWLSVLLEFRAKATDAGGSKQIFGKYCSCKSANFLLLHYNLT